jgi:hypothetical protein
MPCLDEISFGAENMTKHPASCYFIGVLLPLYLAIAMAIGVAMHLGWPRLLCESHLLKVHVMCALFGMVGASVAAIRKYYQVLISEATGLSRGKPSTTNWDWGWIYYYATRPLLGSVLGALSCTLSYVGVQVLAKPSDIEFSNHGRYLLFAIALVSGFSVSHVLDRLNAVSKQVFRGSSSED